MQYIAVHNIRIFCVTTLKTTDFRRSKNAKRNDRKND